MKTSELMRIVAKNILASSTSNHEYICNEMDKVARSNNSSPYRYASARERVNSYIQRSGTFKNWLSIATKKASNGKCNPYNHEPKNYRMVQFLRSMLCETIAKEFEVVGD